MPLAFGRSHCVVQLQPGEVYLFGLYCSLGFSLAVQTMCMAAAHVCAAEKPMFGKGNKILICR
jgi:hypothetical protein